MKIALCLLTRNEKACLEKIFPTIPKPSTESAYDYICAIDGNSSDGTVEFFRDHNIPIIAQSGRGRGDAFLSAFKTLDVDGYIFFSPDGNEDVNDIKKFKAHLEQGADLVIASRMMKGAYNEEDAHFFKWRKWANLAFNFLANIFFKRKNTPFITDTINGFRAITRKAAQKLNLDAMDYTIEYQMSIRALKEGLNIVEFPTHEGQRVAGDTGAPSIPTGIKFLKCFFCELKK